MPEGEVEIRAIKVRDLSRFASQAIENPSQYGVLPINQRRADAQVNNPEAVEDDVGLLVAYLAGECIGYLGILPGLLDDGQRVSRVHWLTTFYVEPDHRHTGAGALLLMRARSLDYDLVMTDASVDAEPLYRALRAPEFGPLNYIELRLDRLNVIGLPLLVLRGWVWNYRRIRAGLDRLLRLSRRFLYPTIRRRVLEGVLRHRKGGWRVSVAEEPPESLFSSGSDHRARFARGRSIVTWMVQYPWPEPADGPTANRYYFALPRQSFDYSVVQVDDGAGQDPRAVAVFSVADADEWKTMKTLDYHLLDSSGDLEPLYLAAVWWGLERRVDCIHLPIECLDLVRSHRLMKLLAIPAQRSYYCLPRRVGSVLPSPLDQIVLRYEDGDVGFT